MPKLNTHHLVCDFGRHKGTLWTRVPASYLLWMVNNHHHKADIAQAELNRRGTVLPPLDISGHAIDRASERCLEHWRHTRHKGEGIHAWLVRMTIEAMARNSKNKDGRYVYNGLQFAVEEDGVWPVLATIMPTNKKKHRKEKEDAT